MKKDSLIAADITHLFPAFGFRKLTILDKGILTLCLKFGISMAPYILVGLLDIKMVISY